MADNPVMGIGDGLIGEGGIGDAYSGEDTTPSGIWVAVNPSSNGVWIPVSANSPETWNSVGVH